jgi:hypothetical protein
MAATDIIYDREGPTRLRGECPNCGQWRHVGRGQKIFDCLHECALRGFAPKIAVPEPPPVDEAQLFYESVAADHESHEEKYESCPACYPNDADVMVKAAIEYGRRG